MGRRGTLPFLRACKISKRPLNAAHCIKVLISFDTGNVTGLALAELLENFEDSFRPSPFFEHLAHSPFMGEEADDSEVAEGLTGGRPDLLVGADAAFAIDEGSRFLSPGGGEQEVGCPCSFGGVIHVLDDEKLQLLSDFSVAILIDPAVRWIGGNDPESLDLAGVDAFDDLIIGPAGLGGDPVFGDFENFRNFLVVGGVCEIVSAKEIGGV
ncbi:MAG: hypothetical protein ACJAVK_002277 [Akkermansiaceae bacterium]